jgi:threonine/homoserine/homoserine lactone efflux protein
MFPFLKGLVIGFSVAAPVGPIGLLCIRRSMHDGRLTGFVSGLGAATADAIGAIVAVLGLTAVTDVLLEHQYLLRLGGGLFLLYLGVATLRSVPPASAEARGATAKNLWGVYASTIVLTLMNPVTVFSFLGIFAAFGIGATLHGAWPAFTLVAGVFLGSAAWWLILSTTAGWLGAKLQHGGLRRVNIVSGAVIAAFGAWQLWALARS